MHELSKANGLQQVALCRCEERILYVMWNLGNCKSFLLALRCRAIRVRRDLSAICSSGTSNRRFVCRQILSSTLSAGIDAHWSQPILMPVPGSLSSPIAAWHLIHSMHI